MAKWDKIKFTNRTPGKVPAQGQELGRHIEDEEFSHILANVEMVKINYTNEKPR
jgi:hypothetical protein